MDQLLGRKKVMGVIETVDMLAREETRQETDQKNKTNFVTKLILDTDFDDQKIASLTTVTIAFVRKIRASLSNKAKN